MNPNLELELEPLNHPPQPNQEWNESYYFVFYSKEHRLGGITRLGFKPNKKEGMTFFLLFLPDGSLAIHQTTEQRDKFSCPKEPEVNGMHHHRNNDGTWNYRFAGDMMILKNPKDLLRIKQQPSLISGMRHSTMDLIYKPIHEPYEYSKYMTSKSRKLGKKAGDEHWEQIAKIDGKITLGGQSYPICNTIGQRDHTYGIRDWTGIDSWLYYVIWFSDRLAVNPAAIVTDDGKTSSGGFIYNGKENVPIKQIRVLDQTFQDYIFPVSSKLELVDAYGKKHLLVGKAGPTVPIPFSDGKNQTSILTQSFGEFELDGQSGGYGIFETLRRLNSHSPKQNTQKRKG